MLKDSVFQWVTHYGYMGIFSLLMFGIVGLPIPDETLLAFTGYLIYKNQLSFVPALLAAFLGSICGITLSYILGRTFGIRLITKYGSVIHLTEEKLNKVHNWFERVGRWGLMFGYYIPGVRHLTAYAAGISSLELPVFALFAYTGGMIWSISFISLGYLLGEEWDWVMQRVDRAAIVISGLLIVSALVYFVRKRRR